MKTRPSGPNAPVTVWPSYPAVPQPACLSLVRLPLLHPGAFLPHLHLSQKCRLCPHTSPKCARCAGPHHAHSALCTRRPTSKSHEVDEEDDKMPGAPPAGVRHVRLTYHTIGRVAPPTQVYSYWHPWPVGLTRYCTWRRMECGGVRVSFSFPLFLAFAFCAGPILSPVFAQRPPTPGSLQLCWVLHPSAASHRSPCYCTNYRSGLR